MKLFIITDQNGAQYPFTGNFFQAMKRAKEVSLSTKGWVNLSNPATGNGRNIKHASV